MKSTKSEYAKLYNIGQLMQVYTYYRVTLGCLLLILLRLDVAPKVLGEKYTDFIFYICTFYTLINFLTLFVIPQRHRLNTQKLPFASLFIDIVCISLLMHFSGGPLTGLGYLLLVAIAAGGMMLRERIVIFLAALATLIVITEGLYRYFILLEADRTLFSSAVLGTLCFVTAISFSYLAGRIRTTEIAAIEQAEHIAHLQRLAQLIIERMRTGIMVLNNQQEIEFYNKSAMRLFDLPAEKNTIHHLSQLPELASKWDSWQKGLPDHTPLLSMPKHITSEIKVNFAELEPGIGNEILVFLEDVRALHQQAQQLKLASLGRLTASIAHEIRNPLGAISHASQLLSESTNLQEGDQRLLKIIQNHCQRVNGIIENVMQLSRRHASQPTRVNLLEWLPHFIQDYQHSIKSTNSIVIDFVEKNLGENNSNTQHNTDHISLLAKFDTSQLQQVLINLCDNGLRYTRPQPGQASLRIETGIDHIQQQPYIRVIDFGPGIKSEAAAHLFEPFFTTENTGSGLGLYICKELCEANQAFINYQYNQLGESCFHIQLSHPDKLY